MASIGREHKEICDALEATGLGWTSENGKKHVKLYLGGHLIGVLPHSKGKSNSAAQRQVKNMVRRIARASEEIRAGTLTDTRRV